MGNVNVKTNRDYQKYDRSVTQKKLRILQSGKVLIEKD